MAFLLIHLVYVSAISYDLWTMCSMRLDVLEVQVAFPTFDTMSGPASWDYWTEVLGHKAEEWVHFGRYLLAYDALLVSGLIYTVSLAINCTVFLGMQLKLAWSNETQNEEAKRCALRDIVSQRKLLVILDENAHDAPAGLRSSAAHAEEHPTDSDGEFILKDGVALVGTRIREGKEEVTTRIPSGLCDAYGVAANCDDGYVRTRCMTRVIEMAPTQALVDTVCNNVYSRGVYNNFLEVLMPATFRKDTIARGGNFPLVASHFIDHAVLQGLVAPDVEEGYEHDE